MKNKNIFYIIFLISLILSINLFFLNKKKKIILLKKINLKNVDNYFIKFSLLSYNEMVNKLNKKQHKKNNLVLFNYISLFRNSSPKTKKKILYLYFVDNHNYHINFIKRILQSKYIIKISPNNPDYLIYNVFHCKHLNKNYSNTIKIAIYTENQIPDFNIADYAISHAHINYLDRHFTYQRYFFNKLLLFNKYYRKARNKVLSEPTRKKFCAAVISNFKITDYFRINFINELSKYKNVDMAGKYKNNVGNITDKIEFLYSYKFSIAMENTEGDGYISEKIIDSFLSGTIPIYYGGYLLDEFINPKSFILIKGNKDIKEKIEYIKKIDNNDEIYRKILKERILIDKNIFKKYNKEYKEFLFHIFDQDKNRAKRRDTIK
jgi:hypothetical protein